MKRYATALLTILVLALGQSLAGTKWQFVKAIDPPGIKPGGNGYHGVAVSKNDRVWVIPYGVTDSVHDNINNRWIKTRCIYIYSSTGTLLDTIKVINMGTRFDTLVNSNRGLNTDNNGNILYSSFSTVYQINYATKAGIRSVVLPEKVPGDGSNTATAAATDSLGELFTGYVIDSYGPLRIYDNTFTYQGNVWDTSRGYSRCLTVNGTGNDVYFAGYTNNAVYRFHSANGSIGPYVLADTILKGMCVESMAWNPKTHNLWVSAGSTNDVPNGYPGVVTHYTAATWYAYNTVTKQVVDSLKWNPVPSTPASDRSGPRPRGIAFSVTGDTAYVCCFNIDSACVQMFANVVTSIEPVNNLIPARYNLEQNFPNPFNPATEIQFTVPRAGYTTLRVFDILGREVATLVDQNMNPGTFKVTLDGANLASGTYIYTLTSGEARITKKMMLLK